jgi:glycosyltransferase involved in cell wall biosynthesis
MRARPRLGIYEPSPRPGGPSRYVDSILKYADPEEFEIIIFGHGGGPFAGARSGQYTLRRVDVEEGDEGRPVASPGSRPDAPPSSILRSLTPSSVKLWAGFGRQTLHLAKIFKGCPVHVLHTNNTGCEESAVAARLAGVPRVVGTFHVDSTYDLGRERDALRHRALECLSNHCLDRAIAVSEATKSDWARRTRLPRRRIETIHNGIDPQSFRRRSARGEARGRLGIPAAGPTVIGGVGRLDEAKGFTHLIDAAARLVAEGRDLLVVLAGDGPLKGDLHAQASRLGIGDRVRFLGFVADIQPVYDALDLFVLPSLCETLGYAHLEAMATELPAVGTLVGGVPEVIVPGETGDLVPPADPAALSAAIRRYFDSADLGRRMGRAGRERVIRHFRERDMADRTLDVYRRLLAEDKPRRRAHVG